jgi:hypothetical protein
VYGAGQTALMFAASAVVCQLDYAVSACRFGGVFTPNV